jgi:hypothetical protein
MKYTTHRIIGMYNFTTVDGKYLRTCYSPKQIAHMYCFDAIDENNSLRVILAREVDFRSFEYMQNGAYSPAA